MYVYNTTVIYIKLSCIYRIVVLNVGLEKMRQEVGPCPHLGTGGSSRRLSLAEQLLLGLPMYPPRCGSFMGSFGADVLPHGGTCPFLSKGDVSVAFPGMFCLLSAVHIWQHHLTYAPNSTETCMRIELLPASTGPRVPSVPLNPSLSTL